MLEVCTQAKMQDWLIHLSGVPAPSVVKFEIVSEQLCARPEAIAHNNGVAVVLDIYKDRWRI